ncbi:MAG: hypothetical protein M3P44_10455 [Actinomycetota bacterium]|nr:hypothetical protein [Actinomycetota bacterium]
MRHELARVLRPGGRLGLTTWTPEGAMGTFSATIGPYLPPPSALADPPTLCGSETHVEGLFEGTGIELDFARRVVTPEPFESTDAALEFFATKFGPMIMARQFTEASGRWPELRAELAALYDRDEPMEYLEILGRKSL